MERVFRHGPRADAAVQRDSPWVWPARIQVWHTMYTGYATQVWSYGGRDFDHEGKCAISEPPVVAATEAFIEALRAAGPASWADQRWYELALDFTHGKYGLIVDSDHYVAYFEDPQSSEVVGRVRYALPPSGPQRRRAAQSLDVVSRHEFALEAQAGGLALHRVGVGSEFPLAVGVRGKYESHPEKCVGLCVVWRARSGLGTVCFNRPRPRRKSCESFSSLPRRAIGRSPTVGASPSGRI